MLEAVHKDYPALTVDLWDDTYITTEMQKASSVGIHKYWFDNAEISDESIYYAFDKAKESWLSTKYVPDLNVYGSIEKTISLSLGDLSQREIKAKSNVFMTSTVSMTSDIPNESSLRENKSNITHIKQ